jgi:hypothetical protein
MTIIGVGLIIIGLFFMCGAALNWDLFLKKENLPLFADFFPRQIARIVIIAWGMAMFGIGLAFVLGMT